MTAPELIAELETIERTLLALFSWLRRRMSDIRRLSEDDDEKVHAAYAAARDSINPCTGIGRPDV